MIIESVALKYGVGILTASAAGVGGVAVHETYSGDSNSLADQTKEQIVDWVDQGILTCTVSADIKAYLGSKTSEIIQVELNEAGYSRSGADNILGNETCKDIYSFQYDNHIVIDGEVGYQTVGRFGGDFDILTYAGDGEEAVAVDNNDIHVQNSLEVTVDIDCKTMNGEDAAAGFGHNAIVGIQTALNNHGFGRGGIDGKFLDLTCDEVVAFQEANGLQADGVVGPATSRALGLDYATLLQETVESAQAFDPKTDCPAPSSCDIEVDLNMQRLLVHGQNGEVLWNIPVQSGKLGYETRNIIYKLGAVEYGINGNPERPSIDYPEAILVNTRSYGSGGQKLHGSYSFNEWATENPDSGSAGCIRTSLSSSYTLAEMPTGTDVKVHGAKPGTAKL